MKYWFAFFLSLSISAASFAQDDGTEHGFYQKDLFAGGSVGLGFGSGTFSIGGNPEIGYTLTQWLDAGLIFNVNYYSVSGSVNLGTGIRTFNYGAGIFTRFYPTNNFFLTAIPEYNIIKTTYKYSNGLGEKFSQEAPSLILGIGYGSREIGNGSFYTMIGIDVGSDVNSPYIGYAGSKLPIIRAGFDFYFGPKKKK